MMAFLRRLFCRHRNQSDAIYIGEETYFRCLDCRALINVDKFFERSSDASDAANKP